MEQIRIVDESDLSPEEDAAIRHGLCLAFPKDAHVFSQTRAWHGSGPSFSALLESDGAILAHVGVVDRTVRVGDLSFRAAGVQNVYSLPNARGRGLAKKALACAMGAAAERGYDIGLLFCVPELEAYYAGDGWRFAPVEGVVRLEDGRPLPLPKDNIAMFLPFRLDGIPSGVLHLCGNDW